MRIDIGIPTNKNESSSWWPKIMQLIRNTEKRGEVEIGELYTPSSAMPSVSKNLATTELIARQRLTDLSRDNILAQAMQNPTKADAIFWIDDDTEPPDGTIERLAQMNQDIAAGIYYYRHPPCHPIAFIRGPDGLYARAWQFQRGEIIYVDAVGMGCTLVKMNVYHEIMRQFVIFKRVPTGTVVAVHRDDVLLVDEVDMALGGKVLVTPGGIIRQEVLTGPISGLGLDKYPFYVMEFGRSEDMHFCELAQRCGFKIALDTGVECNHWGATAISGKDFRMMRTYYIEEVVEKERKEAAYANS